MAHAVAWTGAATWATQLITWICAITVARWLTPSDYGLIGMANVFLGLLTVANDFGLGAAVVVIPDLSKDQVSQLNTVAMGSGVVLFGVSCIAAYPLGYFFRARNLPIVLVSLSLVLVISSFKIIPDALLQREFRFKLLAQIQAAQAVSCVGATMLSVLLGAGYWSLVVGSLSGSLVSTLLVLRSRRHPCAWPRLVALRRSLLFGWDITAQRILWYCYYNSDFAIAGRVLGSAALGSYNVAWVLAEQPLQKFTDLITRVVPPYFSSIQNNEAALGNYVLTITRALSLLMFPATLGLAVVADDLIAVVLGPKWLSSVVPLRILAVYAAARSITTIFSPLLNVRGQSRFVMWNNLLATLYFVPGFYLGSRWGIVGIALVWPFLFPFVAIPLFFRMCKQVGLSLRAYTASLRPALSGSLIMVICLLILKSALPLHAPYLRLLIEIVTGAAIYCTVVAVLYPVQLRRLWTQIRTPAPQAPAFAPEGL